MLTFDETKHEYRVDGVRLPSVTQIVNRFFPIKFSPQDDRTVDVNCEMCGGSGGTVEFPCVHCAGVGTRPVKWYLQRGRMIHKACALMVNGTLDLATVDTRIMGFVQAARKFLEAFLERKGVAWGFPPLAVEQKMHNNSFAGTADLIFPTALIDWKSSDEEKTEIQLGGYAILAEHELKAHPKECIAVELHEDGKFKQSIYQPARCKGLFQSALNLYRWENA